MKRLFRNPVNFDYRQTENPNILVSVFTEFIRANKYIGNHTVLIKNSEVPEGCMVSLRAVSTKTGHGELKNNVTNVRNGVACFEDLRFISCSGRNTRFDIYYDFECGQKRFTVDYKSAIKVTVDGPRPRRSPFKKNNKYQIFHPAQMQIAANSDELVRNFSSVSPNSICSQKSSSSSESSSCDGDIFVSDYPDQEGQMRCHLLWKLYCENLLKYNSYTERHLFELFKDKPVFWHVYYEGLKHQYHGFIDSQRNLKE